MNKESKYYLNLMIKFLILAFIALGIYLTYKVAIFYIPFVIAFIIASIAEPLIKFFMKKLKLKRKLASILSLLLILTLLIGLCTLLITNLISEATSLIDSLNVYFKGFYDTGIQLLDDLQNGRLEIPEEFVELANNSFSAFLNSAKDVVLSILTSTLNFFTSIPSLLTNGCIMLLAVVFICFDRDYVKNIFKKHVPKEWLSNIKKVFSQMCSVSFRYIKAEAKLSGICFVFVLVSLLLLSVVGFNISYPIIMAILIGFVDLLPLFGAGVVMIPWALYSLVSGNMLVGIAVFVIWCIWAVIKSLIEPHFVSKQMGMHPLFTLIGMYTGFKLFGVLGLILGPIAFLILKNVFSELFAKGILKTLFEKE